MEPEENRSLITRFKSFLTQSKRVFKITKKPTMAEFKVIVKVTGIGIVIIGILGFLIHIMWTIVKP
ncbi:MAG: protein translocase SEC61 complex subunit gamma [Nanoarchaeota archaeon]|nr:protein translocase SEC61 complex subunit gamma [Nanoarchaeota archaeon]|tara:strand:+ start:2520 stop:2717 length:198 start_codon:yes stop_codon:yes gene_type:complete